MQKTMIALTALFLSFSSFATYQTPEELAVKEFLAAQYKVGEASAARESLNREGYTRQSETQAVLLSGGCGFAGCDSTYLVTTPYGTQGANTRTRVVAGIVEYAAAGRFAEVVKVLNDQDMEQLFST